MQPKATKCELNTRQLISQEIKSTLATSLEFDLKMFSHYSMNHDFSLQSSSTIYLFVLSHPPLDAFLIDKFF